MKKYRRKVAFMLLAAVLTASGLLDLRLHKQRQPLWKQREKT